MTLNPFRYFAEQRARDRELTLALIERMFQSAEHQSTVAIEQAKAMSTFMHMFMQVDGPPIRRVSDDLTEFEAEEARWKARSMD